MTDKRIIERELEGFGIRLNKKPPAIIFKKKEKGGINMTNTVPLTHITQDEVKAVLSEYRIHNADISFKEDSTIDDLIDVVEVCTVSDDDFDMDINITIDRATGKYDASTLGVSYPLTTWRSIYIPCIYVLNKIDQISIEELDLIYKIPNAVPICAHHEWNFDELLETMWEVGSIQWWWRRLRYWLGCLEIGSGPCVYQAKGPSTRLWCSCCLDKWKVHCGRFL